MHAVELSILIPCFNEEAILVGTVDRIREYLLRHFPDLGWEMIFVNDGSTDGTLARLKALSLSDARIRHLSYERNRGQGEALKLGLRASLGAYVITLDADLSYDVDHIAEIYACLHDDARVDAVVVSPYLKGGIVRNVPFNRLFVSRMANWILSGFFEYRLATVTSIARGYRGDLIRRIYLTERGNEVLLEILRKLSLYQAHIVEIPGRLIWKKHVTGPRSKNVSKVTRSARKQLFYAAMVNPARLFGFMATVLLAVGFYETLVIAFKVLGLMSGTNEGFFQDLWLALRGEFSASPHTFVIASGSLILGFQVLALIILLHIIKLGQDETLRHLLVTLEPPGDRRL